MSSHQPAPVPTPYILILPAGVGNNGECSCQSSFNISPSACCGARRLLPEPRQGPPKPRGPYQGRAEPRQSCPAALLPRSGTVEGEGHLARRSLYRLGALLSHTHTDLTQLDGCRRCPVGLAGQTDAMWLCRTNSCRFSRLCDCWKQL